MIAAHQHGVADRNMRMCPPNTSVRILTGRNFDNVKSEFLPVPKDARGGAERPVHFFAVDTFYWVSCFANSKVHASIQLLSLDPPTWVACRAGPNSENAPGTERIGFV